MFSLCRVPVCTMTAGISSSTNQNPELHKWKKMNGWMNRPQFNKFLLQNKSCTQNKLTDNFKCYFCDRRVFWLLHCLLSMVKTAANVNQTFESLGVLLRTKALHVLCHQPAPFTTFLKIAHHAAAVLLQQLLLRNHRLLQL